MGNDAPCKVVEIGIVQIKMFDGTVRTLTDVRHVPELKKNLISLGTLDSNGCNYRGRGGVLKVSKGALVVMKGKKTNGLYLLKGSTITGVAGGSSSSTNLDTTKLWHLRLGHVSEKRMMELSKRGLLCSQNTGKLEFCKHCIYMLTFIDDYSRRVWVYILKRKDEVFVNFKQWKTMIEKQTRKSIKRLIIDNGLELCQGEFNEFCKNEAIVRHHTVRYIPQHNGVVERMNRTLLERARCMLSNAGLPNIFWVEAVNTACYLVNRSPPIAIDCKLLMKNDGTNGYRLWCPDGKSSRFLISRDVTFDEPAMLKKKEEEQVDAGEDQEFEEQVELEIQVPQGVVRGTPDEPVIKDAHESGDDNITPEEVQPEEKHVLQSYSLVRDRQKRNVRAPQRFRHEDLVAYAFTLAEDIEVQKPFTYGEAIGSLESKQWSLAMNEKMESLYKNNTWELVKPPKGFTQREGVDFNEVFSLVVKHSSICVLLATVALHDMELQQLDVKTAFLHGELEEQICHTPPRRKREA
ncbi:retrovirus-related pol polyprotein from transposon TNT 1-94 [Tanacetum coccineum]